MEKRELQDVVDGAVERLGETIDKVLNVNGRLISLEKDCATHTSEVAYVKATLHAVRSGTESAPGLAGHTLSIRELQMKQEQAVKDMTTLTSTVETLAKTVQTLASDARLQAWKIGAVIASLLFVANQVVAHLKIF